MNEVIVAMLCSAGALWVLLGPSVTVRRMTAVMHRPHRSPMLALLGSMRARMNAARDRRRDIVAWRTAVIELCDGLSAELSAGRPPEVAFTNAVTVLDSRVAGPVLAKWRNGHGNPAYEDMPDVPSIDQVLDELSVKPGAEGLRMLAACWRIGVDKGGAFAAVVGGVATALRDDEAQRLEIAAQLAGPRATARLLAGLPLLGLALGVALGADPLAFLLGTIPGMLCLLSGIGLDVVGLWWTHRLARSAEIPR
ncbi:type II secretion system F family protein [Thermomonospora umbrina]|nr:type II secretion system protein [Thermomonospora umbrina]